MQHIMKLYETNFDLLLDGNKIREYRLYDEKRKLINIGDEIKFIKLTNMAESVIVTVDDVEVFGNWYDAYKKYYFEDFADTYKSVDSVVEDTFNGYYTKEESDRYGCVVITFSRVLRNIKNK